MDEPQTVTPEHLRTLLGSDAGDATLGLLEGRIEILGADQGEDGRSALGVISRDELINRIGAEPTDEELTKQAGALTAAVQQLGG